MSNFEEDARIVDNSTRLRLAELEVDKAKIEARSDPGRQFTLRMVSSFSIVACLIGGIIWSVYSHNVKEDQELTRQAAERTRQEVQDTEQARLYSDSNRDIAKWRSDHLKTILEIVRNSKTDDLALEALRQQPKKD